MGDRKRPTPKARAALLAAWAETPIGTAVIVTRDDGRELTTKTRSEPWELCGTPVIMVDGISGGYALERVRKA